MAKKHKNKPAKGPLLVKVQTQAQKSEFVPRYATDEMVEEAMERVMKIHAALLQKLADN